jgi:hypothetical protein
MAYKERNRHIPSPLNLTRSPPPLLYDLPSEPTSSSSNPAPFITSKSPRSPPRTPRGRPIGLLSPTSTSFSLNLNAGSKNTTAASAYGLHHPQPLNGHQSSYSLPTPTRSASGTPTQEMDAFGVLCRAWYVPPHPDLALLGSILASSLVAMLLCFLPVPWEQAPSPCISYIPPQKA